MIESIRNDLDETEIYLAARPDDEASWFWSIRRRILAYLRDRYEGEVSASCAEAGVVRAAGGAGLDVPQPRPSHLRPPGRPPAFTLPREKTAHIRRHLVDVHEHNLAAEKPEPPRMINFTLPWWCSTNARAIAIQIAVIGLVNVTMLLIVAIIALGKASPESQIVGHVLLLVALAAATVTYFGSRFFQTKEAKLGPRCPRCHYDLRNELERGCPECGWRRENSARPEPTPPAHELDHESGGP